MFNTLPDRRTPGDGLYDTATIIWMVVLGFMCRHGSRNGMDAARNTGQAPTNLLAMSGQRRWPEGRPVTAPCTQTATRLLDDLEPLRLENILVAATQTLIRDKLFDDTRLAGRVMVVVDGTTLYFCAWVTNLPIYSGERACAIAAAGRGRSHIEESYNVQKNGGCGLEHAFQLRFHYGQATADRVLQPKPAEANPRGNEGDAQLLSQAAPVPVRRTRRTSGRANKG